MGREGIARIRGGEDSDDRKMAVRCEGDACSGLTKQSCRCLERSAGCGAANRHPRRRSKPKAFLAAAGFSFLLLGRGKERRRCSAAAVVARYLLIGLDRSVTDVSRMTYSDTFNAHKKTTRRRHRDWRAK